MRIIVLNLPIVYVPTVEVTGMRGKNTETLTYRGPDLAERDQTRVSAGCVPGYCADLIAKGLIPADFNSCDEVRLSSSIPYTE